MVWRSTMCYHIRLLKQRTRVASTVDGGRRLQLKARLWPLRRCDDSGEPSQVNESKKRVVAAVDSSLNYFTRIGREGHGHSISFTSRVFLDGRDDGDQLVLAFQMALAAQLAVVQLPGGNVRHFERTRRVRRSRPRNGAVRNVRLQNGLDLLEPRAVPSATTVHDVDRRHSSDERAADCGPNSRIYNTAHTKTSARHAGVVENNLTNVTI